MHRRIKDMLPGQPGDPGVTAKDNRLLQPGRVHPDGRPTGGRHPG
jgi:hypothetical protein